MWTTFCNSKPHKVKLDGLFLRFFFARRVDGVDLSTETHDVIDAFHLQNFLNDFD
jgi:hypothetical protein